MGVSQSVVVPTHLSTSVEATFQKPEDASTIPTGAADGSTTPQYVMEESKRAPIVPKAPSTGTLGKYFCVFPSSTLLKLVTTSGSVSISSPGLSKAADEIVSFSGSSLLAPLRYPKASSVTFNIIGNLVGKTSPTDVITVVFDSTRNALVASKLCYGNVHVQYRAPFDLWLAKFDVAPLPITPTGLPINKNTATADDDPVNLSKPMTILAYWKNPTSTQDPYEVLASLNLSPPDFTLSSDPTDTAINPASNFGTGSQLPSIRFEVDPQNVSRYLPPITVGVPNTGVRVRVIPAVQPDVKMTSGQIVAWLDAAGESVVEQLAYSGSMSQSLRYQPAGSITLEAVGYFYDRWGRQFTPNLIKPGDSCTTVTWADNGSWSNPLPKVANADEVIVCDEFMNAIPAYGIVRATYSYTYKPFVFAFDYDANAKVFKSAFLTGSYPGAQGFEIANIKLDPPFQKGIK